ncbi:MAG: ATP-binding cassette domain-containing protein [Desulfobacter sp.]|nr:MAG: ATP-binding cassette domain-containing protein [Desulfobacter sp.]
MIEITNLNFTYRDATEIFSQFSLRIQTGESWSIIGPSGCGKTTLLYLIAGLKRPSSGQIHIAGNPLTAPRPSTGLVLQDHGLLPWSTVRENTVLGFKIRHLYGPDGKHCPTHVTADDNREKELADHWLSWLGIGHLAEKYPGQLSRGQRQRAAIARTLVLEPDLLLMDEPFSALDAPIRKELQKVMNRFHNETGLTSITVTHNIEEAVLLGSKILVLASGVNSVPLIIDNKLAGKTEDTESPEFMDVCRQLHHAMGDMP